MPNINVTKKLIDLKTLFNNVKEVYYKYGEIKTSDLSSTALAVDIELPVLADGVSFDTGTADISELKITSGAVWTTKSEKGDSDISIQVASIAGAVNDIFMNNVKAVASASGILDGTTYKGAAYSLAPKKVTGALVMRSEDRQSVIILPSVEMYSNLIAADGDNPAYFNVKITPVENSEGSDIIILSAVLA